MAEKNRFFYLSILMLIVLSVQAVAQSDQKPVSKPENLTLAYGAVVRGPMNRKEIALTFTADTFGDGGPVILETLKNRNIKAAFFLTGNFLRSDKFKPLVDSIIKDGHYLGPHSDAHLLYCSWEEREKTLVSREEFISDLEKNYAALKEFGVDKKEASYFMPPFEWYNEEIANWAKEAGLVLVNPTPGIMTAADYTTPEMKNYLSSEDILNQVLEYEKNQPSGLNGFILLIHLGTAPERADKFYDLLNKLLDELEKRGYSFVKLTEWLKGAKEEKPVTEQEVSAEKKETPPQARREYTPEDFKKSSKTVESKYEEYFELSLTPVWESQVNYRISSLNIIGDSILWTTEDKKFYISRIEDIKNLRQVQLEQEISFSPYSDGRLIWLAAGNLALGLNISGQVEIRIKVDGPITGQPVSDGRQLFLLSGKSIQAFSLENGLRQWSTGITEEVAGDLFFSEEALFVPLTAGRLMILDKKTGQTRYVYDFKETISSVVCFDQRSVFVGTDKGNIFRFDAKKKKIHWKVKTGSQWVEYFLVRGKELYAFTSGGLMLKLNRNNGNLLKWQAIPGRVFSRPLIYQDELIVACSDRLLLGFNLKSDQRVSSTILPFEISSGPCVHQDILIVSSYSYRDDKSIVHAFHKELQARLLASVKSPQAVGQKVTLTAQSAGFTNPRYEFFVRPPDGEERLVRKAARKNTWTWFPVKPGKYELSVRVYDKKNNKKISLEYNVVSKLEKKEEKEKTDE